MRSSISHFFLAQSFKSEAALAWVLGGLGLCFFGYQLPSSNSPARFTAIGVIYLFLGLLPLLSFIKPQPMAREFVSSRPLSRTQVFDASVVVSIIEGVVGYLVLLAAYVVGSTGLFTQDRAGQGLALGLEAAGAIPLFVLFVTVTSSTVILSFNIGIPASGRGRAGGPGALPFWFAGIGYALIGVVFIAARHMVASPWLNFGSISILLLPLLLYRWIRWYVQRSLMVP